MKKGNVFFPEEVIFASTDACNLHCPHCFVPRNAKKIDIGKAKSFLTELSKNIAPDGLPFINKIGFSGGEPFLYPEFLYEITSHSVNLGFSFDRIMTNAVWWNNEDELKEKLNKLYQAGYDGKIGISFDRFHRQNPEKIALFSKSVSQIWNNPEILVIQSVIDTSIPLKEDEKLIYELASLLNADIQKELKKDGSGQMAIENDDVFILVYRFLPSLQSENPDAWKSKKWFKEDYCKGPGNIFYIHPSGKIAPCCGFSNENPELFIGSINDSFEKIMKNSKENSMVSLCFQQGLSSLIPEIEKDLPGKTEDICTFCDYVCKKSKN